MAVVQDSVEQKVTHLFSRLQATIESDDDEASLGLAQKILDISRDDEDALYCKLVSLIRLSKFQPALDLLRNRNKRKNGAKRYQFEEAYCLYRKDKFKESMNILTSLQSSDPGIMELIAQIQYRQEKYLMATNTYKQLINEESGNEEKISNYYASLSLSGGVVDGGVVSSHTGTMEQCFNLACCHLTNGRGQEAMDMLIRAETLYQESLEEDGLTEEEIAEEMGVIQVQRGYTSQILGQPKQAMSYYNSLLKLRPSDPSLVAIASNNILVLNGDKDVFDSKKRIKILTSEGASRKLTQSQKQHILFNRCLFALQINQLEQCRELGVQLKVNEEYSDLALLGEVALLYREKKMNLGIEVLDNYLRSCPSAKIELYAILSQLYLNRGSIDQVSTTLKSIPSYLRSVGVASTLAGLYISVGDVRGAIAVLDEMLQYWIDTSGDVDDLKVDLVIQVSKCFISMNEYERSTKILEKLLYHHKDDLKLMALLISSYSHYHPQGAEDVSQHLPPFQTPVSLDTDMLEKIPIFRHSRRPAERVEVFAAAAKKEKKKKKRKPRLPKNYDPDVTSDPERWLPLRERSYYRKNRRKGISSSVRGTQGMSVASASIMNQLDASKVPVNKTPVGDLVSTEGGGVTSPRAKSQPQANKKKAKKKKGGGKW